jgi:hypothetical protein
MRAAMNTVPFTDTSKFLVIPQRCLGFVHCNDELSNLMQSKVINIDHFMRAVLVNRKPFLAKTPNPTFRIIIQKRTARLGANAFNQRFGRGSKPND